MAGAVMGMRAQVELRALGLYSGPIDGIMGEGTRSALRQYQRSRRLTETGALDNATLGAMGIPC
jgi:peptidoglycan hydrolase-like protein with peptidoglycan-binding domain